jgi:hypothetical protein
LTARRYDDQKNDLWTTYNRVQENVIKGGIRQVNRRKSRGVNGIDENLRLNKALWTLAEQMKQLKEAA